MARGQGLLSSAVGHHERNEQPPWPSSRLARAARHLPAARWKPPLRGRNGAYALMLLSLLSLWLRASACSGVCAARREKLHRPTLFNQHVMHCRVACAQLGHTKERVSPVPGKVWSWRCMAKRHRETSGWASWRRHIRLRRGILNNEKIIIIILTRRRREIISRRHFSSAARCYHNTSAFGIVVAGWPAWLYNVIISRREILLLPAYW